MTNQYSYAMECLLIELYQEKRCVDDGYDFHIEYDLVPEGSVTVTLCDMNGFPAGHRTFEVYPDWMRDRLCNMDIFANYTLEPRSFILQDHTRTNNLRAANQLLSDPIVRKYYLSFISVKTREATQQVPRKNLLVNTIKIFLGRWTAPPTPWEQDVALFLQLDNQLIENRNEVERANFGYHTVEEMRYEWMPYGTSEFCAALWAMYGEPEDVFYVGKGGWLEFDDYLSYANVYFWVEKVIISVKVMEASLPQDMSKHNLLKE